MSKYDDLTTPEEKEEVRDLSLLAAQIVDWAGGPNTLTFEEACSTARDFWNRATAMSTPPVAATLEPATLEVPGPDSEVVVRGTGFNSSTVINWNGGDEPTDFVSETEVKTTVKPSTVQAPLPFTLPVYVHHGGIKSASLDFTFTAPPPPPEGKRR